LRRFLRGAPVTLIWDNLPSHHSRVMSGWLEDQRHWLAVEYLPGYAHDLDPVEGLWANLKGQELATCAATRSPRSPTPPGKGSPESATSACCCFRFCGTASWSYEK
jgi:transposase